MNFFDHKDLGNHLLQLCPRVVKHPVYLIHKHIFLGNVAISCKNTHPYYDQQFNFLSYVHKCLMMT
jgi:hypothetical protein